MFKSQRAEVSERCPNCGRFFKLGHCYHSSTYSVEVEGGAFHSTLYGVCSECAKNHSDRSFPPKEADHE